MTIQALPPAPSRSTTPSAFAATADAFVAALQQFGIDANATAAQVNTDAGTASAGAATAASAASTATAAAASAVSASSATGTSTTSMTVGAGSKTITIQTGKSFVPGQFVMVARTSDVTTYCAGQVTGYASGTGVLSFTSLAFNGSGSFTDWTVSLSPPVGAGLTLLATATASNSATMDFTGIDGTYDEYELHILHAIPVAANDAAQVRTSSDNGATYAANAGDYLWQATDSTGTTARSNSGSTTATAIRLSTAFITVEETAIWGGLCSVMRLFTPADTTMYKRVTFGGSASFASTGDALAGVYGVGQRQSASAVNAIRFMFAAGNIASGTFKLYGMKK